jgi:two-component system phosphate regulon response regulator PhoB
MKILLVEDSKFLRLATGRALARAGYEMSFAGDGDEALLMAAKNLPDLILLDMMLPKMSGAEVLKALKKELATAAIPIVVLTGLAQTNAARLQGDGAFAFLTKADLALDQGVEPLLASLREIVKKLPNAPSCGSRARPTQ